jgi:hypothetical protein
MEYLHSIRTGAVTYIMSGTCMATNRHVYISRSSMDSQLLKHQCTGTSVACEANH